MGFVNLLKLRSKCLVWEYIGGSDVTEDCSHWALEHPGKHVQPFILSMDCEYANAGMVSRSIVE